jgi:hypothetical protein
MAHLLKVLMASQGGGAAKRPKKYPATKNHTFKTSYNATVNHYAIRYVYQWKDFVANGLLWDFYVTLIGEDLVLCWRTSSDSGDSWSDESTYATVGYPEDIALYTDGVYIHIASILGASTIRYRRGLLNADGSITFTDEVDALNVFPNTASRPTIAADSDGYPYIGYTLKVGTSYYPYVIKSSTNDGTWAMADGYPLQLSTTSSSAWRVKVLPRAGNDMIAIYLRTGYVLSKPYTEGVGWGAQEDWLFPIATSEYFDAVSDTVNDEVWLVGTATWDTGRVIQTGIRYSDGTIEGLGAVVDDEGNVVVFTTSICPGLCLDLEDPSSPIAYVFWLGEPTANHVYYQKIIDYVPEWGYTDLAEALEPFQYKWLFQVTPYMVDNLGMLTYGTSATGRKLYSLTFET